MHKQLVLLHNAVAAYFSGNAVALEGTIKQFNVKVNHSENNSQASQMQPIQFNSQLTSGLEHHCHLFNHF